MSELLEKAFAEASKLTKIEQDALAAFILEELASERLWVKTFNDSTDILSQLADDTLVEHRAGKTQELNPEKL